MIPPLPPKWVLIFFLFLTACIAGNCTVPEEPELSSEEIAFIAKRIYRNECGGNEKYLLTWNMGEAFPSLGIGHFIWYPKDVRGPFTESFPALLAFAVKAGEALPAGLSQQSPAPWSSRQQFMARQQSPFTTELRNWLKSTRNIQAGFILHRFHQAVPRLLEQVSWSERNTVARRIQALLASAQGTYALVDYTNFKGEGINPEERYRNQGWGLLQVLQHMKDDAEPLHAFADSAAAMLKRRVENAPPERGEKRWLTGWLKRIESYRPS